MAEDAFEISIPRRINDDAEIVATFRDTSLLGSRHHVLRFDVYPVHAPSHPQRHHGFWDIPMYRIRNGRTALAFKDGNVWVKGRLFTASFPPTWRGTLPLAGPCMMTVSMLDLTSNLPKVIVTKSSRHVLSDADDFPFVNISLYVTRICNLQCEGCWRESFQTWNVIDTPSEVIDAVVEAAPQFQSVLLHGEGEPLMNPNLPHILTKIKNKLPSTGQVGIQTNGMLLNQNVARDLVDRGANWLSISMDGATKLTMEGIRRGSHFETVVENLRHAVEYGKRTRPGNIGFTIHFTTRESNVQEIPSLMRLACSLGVDNVTVEPHRNSETGEFRVLSADVLDPLYREAKRMGAEYGVSLTVKRLRPFEHPRCEFSEELYLHVSGVVTSCASRRPGESETPVHILGNVKEKPLLEILNSDRVRNFRRRIMAGDFPEGCASCGFKLWGSSIPY